MFNVQSAVAQLETLQITLLCARESVYTGSGARRIPPGSREPLFSPLTGVRVEKNMEVEVERGLLTEEKRDPFSFTLTAVPRNVEKPKVLAEVASRGSPDTFFFPGHIA